MVPENDGNWIKLYRKVIHNPVFQDAHLFQIFIYCLCRANYKERKILFNGTEIVLRPGEFISGRREASRALKLKSIMWDRKLQVLENLQIVNRKTNNQFSIISIINWEAYQSNERQDEQANEQRMNNGRTTDEQRMNTDKKEKKEKKEKNKIFIRPTLAEVSVYCRERGKGVDPERWLNHYESNGWMVGKNKMQDWKAAVRTWEGNIHSMAGTTKSLFEKNLEAGKRWLERTENDPSPKA